MTNKLEQLAENELDGRSLLNFTDCLLAEMTEEQSESMFECAALLNINANDINHLEEI